jgi:hypothetical protein
MTAEPSDLAANTCCVFCFETIKPGASVCPHCGGVLVPFQRLINDRAVLEARLTALEGEVAALRAVPNNAASPTDVPQEAAQTPAQAGFVGWPHMADNLFLGLMALLAAHWLATTLPSADRAFYRLAAFAVALPFGFRFEMYARGSTTDQVLAAVMFGGLGTLAVGTLDIALAGGVMPGLSVRDIASSVAAIILSHLAGSFWAAMHRRRAERTISGAADSNVVGVALHLTTAAAVLRLVRPDKIQTHAAAVKSVTDAAAAIVTTAVALWAAVGHLLS